MLNETRLRRGNSLEAWPIFICALLLSGSALASRAGALQDYVQRPDDSFAWTLAGKKEQGGFTVARLNLTSQTWHDLRWTHAVQVARPATIRNPKIALLIITGDGDGSSSFNTMKIVGERAGMMVAVVANVPNQPLFDGKREDQIIAYTFDQYLKTGDKTWPLLLPMVKSAVRAMDAIQAFAESEYHQKIEQFVLTGGSKRGWTTWLSAASDPRVVAIAPMVIDMLNMKAQTQWAQKVYGAQSEKIRAYTELHLIEKMDTPEMTALRDMVDPYAYRQQYKLPKLILIGTNDPYWTVDSLKHYWYDLPGPKWVFQAPNTGHSANRDSIQTMATFFQMVADGQPLPTMDWQLSAAGPGAVTVKVSQPAKAACLWTADSPIRDFRKAKWTNRVLALQKGGQTVSAEIAAPATGYRAFMAEVTLTAASGQDYKLSTQVQVIPDDVK